jgi:hypothetical protein
VGAGGKVLCDALCNGVKAMMTGNKTANAIWAVQLGKTPERMTEISFSGFVRPIFLKCWLLLAGDKLFFHSWPVEEH